MWVFYAGFAKPTHLTEEDYAKITEDKARTAAATLCLKKYSLTENETADEIPTVALVTREEVTLAIEHVGRLLARIEAPEMRTVMSKPQIHTQSMDMRRALASLIRVRDAQ